MEEVHEDIIIITSLFYFNNNKLIKNHFNFGGVKKNSHIIILNPIFKEVMASAIFCEVTVTLCL